MFPNCPLLHGPTLVLLDPQYSPYAAPSANKLLPSGYTLAPIPGGHRTHNLEVVARGSVPDVDRLPAPRSTMSSLNDALQ
jgi:hypothetical protein